MNVKPGDMAIVVGLRGQLSQNNGLIVEVLRAVTCPCTCSKAMWLCRSQGRTIFGWLLQVIPGCDLEAGIADSNLRPVSGLDVSEATSALHCEPVAA